MFSLFAECWWIVFQKESYILYAAVSMVLAFACVLTWTGMSGTACGCIVGYSGFANTAYFPQTSFFDDITVGKTDERVALILP
jgi:hypothetical protein